MESKRIERVRRSKLIQMNLTEPDVELFMNLTEPDAELFMNLTH